MCGGTIPDVESPMKKIPVYRGEIIGRGRQTPIDYILVPAPAFHNVDYATFVPEGDSYSIHFYRYKYKKRK